MAEGMEAPKIYSCACGLSQDYKKKKFAAKCPYCRTRMKYLVEQSSFDSGSAAVSSSVPTEEVIYLDTPEYDESPSTDGQSTQSEASCRPERHKHTKRRNHEGRKPGQARKHTSNAYRRSRSVERLSNQRVTESSAYNTSSEAGRPASRSRGERSRRSDSEGPSRRSRRVYSPPTYEEALVSSMSGLSTLSSLNTGTSTSSALRARSSVSTEFLDTSSELLDREAAYLEAQRSGSRMSHKEASRQTKRAKKYEKELRRERKREAEVEMEKEKQRDAELTQYCECYHCTKVLYKKYYEEAVKEGTALPMETQLIMNDVMADGMAACSLM